MHLVKLYMFGDRKSPLPGSGAGFWLACPCLEGVHLSTEASGPGSARMFLANGSDGGHPFLGQGREGVMWAADSAF